MLIIVLFVLLFYLSIILSVYAIQWAPVYILAKRYGYSKPWLVFIPIVNKVVMHDIGLGKKERGFFIFWSIGNIIWSYGYTMYYILIESNADVRLFNSFTTENLILTLIILYKMHFTYKFLLNVTNIKWVSILGCIPILNILIFWYIVVKY